MKARRSSRIRHDTRKYIFLVAVLPQQPHMSLQAVQCGLKALICCRTWLYGIKARRRWRHARHHPYGGPAQAARRPPAPLRQAHHRAGPPNQRHRTRTATDAAQSPVAHPVDQKCSVDERARVCSPMAPASPDKSHACYCTWGPPVLVTLLLWLPEVSSLLII